MIYWGVQWCSGKMLASGAKHHEFHSRRVNKMLCVTQYFAPTSRVNQDTN